MIPGEPRFDGLRFACTQCSRCCRHDEGFVYLSPRDLERLCSRFGLTEAQLIATYARWSPNFDGDHVTLRERENRDCVFWADGGCSVYEDRPVQCRAYPFWRHIVETEGGWSREAGECPGIGVGSRVDRRVIEELMDRREREGHATRSRDGG